MSSVKKSRLTLTFITLYAPRKLLMQRTAGRQRFQNICQEKGLVALRALIKKQQLTNLNQILDCQNVYSSALMANQQLKLWLPNSRKPKKT